MLKLAVPVVMAELGWVSMSIVDTMMVGRLSPEAIGAVSVGSSLFLAVAISLDLSGTRLNLHLFDSGLPKGLARTSLLAFYNNLINILSKTDCKSSGIRLPDCKSGRAVNDKRNKEAKNCATYYLTVPSPCICRLETSDSTSEKYA